MLLLPLLACWRAAPEAPPVVHRPPPAGFLRAPGGVPTSIVDCLGGANFTAIQDAIDAAPDRAWIEVMPCTYTETLDSNGKSLWISSTGGSAVTRIDAQHDGPVLEVEDGEGDRMALVGFTLEDGEGAAVEVDLAALRLEDVVITGADGNETIDARSADLELVDVVVDGTNEGWGHQVFADKGSVVARGLEIDCGSGDGLFLGHGAFLVDDATLDCDGDTAVEIEHSVGRFVRSTLVGRFDLLTEEEHPDDRVRVWNSVVKGDVEVEFGTFSLRNSIVNGQLSFVTVADTVEIESSIFLSAACAITSDSVLGPVRYNDFANGPSMCAAPDVVGIDGNVAVDPMFVNPAAGDLHLQAGSPVIDAGVPDDAYDDVDGSRNDMGVYGGRFSMDGGW